MGEGNTLSQCIVFNVVWRLFVQVPAMFILWVLDR